MDDGFSNRMGPGPEPSRTEHNYPNLMSGHGMANATAYLFGIPAQNTTPGRQVKK